MLTYDFDRGNIESIKKQAEKVLHKCLREVLSPADISSIEANFNIDRKGHFGEVVEKYVFDKKADSLSAPDFPEALLELKTTPLKKTKKNRITAKERLVLGMIDYFGIVKEDWDKSAFLKKNANLLILFYLYRKSETILDYRFERIKLLRLLSDLPAADIRQIQADWEAIAAKIKNGKAHELSEGDTFYLGACTKGATAEKSLRAQPNSPTKAKSRAFSLKQTYLNYLITTDRAKFDVSTSEIMPGAKHAGIAAFVHNKLSKYLGMSVDDIHKATEAYLTPGSKSFYADLARAMLGAKKKKIAEFEKADVRMKIVRLKRSGTPKESMSFPAIDYKEIIKEDWEGSTLRDLLSSRKYLFIIYQYDKDEVLRFKQYLFWNIPESDLDGPVREVWERTKAQILAHKADDLPKIKDNPVSHVRPHGRDSRDLAPTHYGAMVKKQSFWLNASYIAKQLKKAL
ncbi:MAG: Sau3AI family type II restriction endonuclease [Elusimicrobiota bacterium]